MRGGSGPGQDPPPGGPGWGPPGPGFPGPISFLGSLCNSITSW